MFSSARIHRSQPLRIPPAIDPQHEQFARSAEGGHEPDLVVDAEALATARALAETSARHRQRPTPPGSDVPRQPARAAPEARSPHPGLQKFFQRRSDARSAPEIRPAIRGPSDSGVDDPAAAALRTILRVTQEIEPLVSPRRALAPDDLAHLRVQCQRLAGALDTIGAASARLLASPPGRESPRVLANLIAARFNALTACVNRATVAAGRSRGSAPALTTSAQHLLRMLQAETRELTARLPAERPRPGVRPAARVVTQFPVGSAPTRSLTTLGERTSVRPRGRVYHIDPLRGPTRDRPVDLSGEPVGVPAWHGAGRMDLRDRPWPQRVQFAPTVAAAAWPPSSVELRGWLASRLKAAYSDSAQVLRRPLLERIARIDRGLHVEARHRSWRGAYASALPIPSGGLDGLTDDGVNRPLLLAAHQATMQLALSRISSRYGKVQPGLR